MLTCSKCGKELEEGTRTCDACGAQILESSTCPNCGEQIGTEFAFCPKCGVALSKAPEADGECTGQADEAVSCSSGDNETGAEADGSQDCGASMTEDEVNEQPSALAEVAEEKKKLPKKAILFGAIGVALVAVLIVVFTLFAGSGGTSQDDYVLYVKDQEIFFTDLKTDSEAWQLTARLVDTDDIDDEDLAYADYTLGIASYMSEDGKYLFFPDKIRDDDEGFNVYYREVNKPEAEAVKIDSGVQYYTVNAPATVVTYLKGEDGNLYQYQIGEDSKDKIASEVCNFSVSEDGKKIIYMNTDGSLYLQCAGEDKEKLASEIAKLEYVSEDIKTVYYTKDDSLYKQVEGEDKVKIASDVYKVIRIYESGEVYYLTSSSAEVSLLDYVTDDMEDIDASITKPAYPEYPDSPDYPYRRNYETEEEYDAAYEAYEEAYEAYEDECDRLYEEYEAAYDLYWEKEYRDELRIGLETETLENANYSLCFYNGTEKIVVTDAFAGEYYSNYTVAADAPVISYEAYNQSGFDKVKLSEIGSIYEVEFLVEDALYSSAERYVAVKDTATVIDQEKKAGTFRINSSGTDIYYIDNIPDEEEYGELYHISIADGVVGTPELYDSDVYTGYCYFVGDSELQYFKDYKDMKGELYIDKNRIDYDVYVYNVDVDPDSNKVVYFTDWNDEKEYGMLKVYQGNEAVKVADDVYDFFATSDGHILYLYDYSLNHYKGELHEWVNNESRKIDDDVVCILPIYDSKYRGSMYGW